MFEYLKYLPLLEVLAKHPNLVKEINKLITQATPLIPEIQEAIAEANLILQRIYANPRAAMAAVMPPVEFYSPPPRAVRKRRKKR